MLKLDIIVVNWNGGKQLNTCLDLIRQADSTGYTLGKIIVVDNASTDGSAENVPADIEMIKNKENIGFGAAANRGASASDGDYLLILNPDIRLKKDTLTRLLAYISMGTAKRAGIISVQLLDDDGTINRTCARFPTVGLVFSQMLGLDRLIPRRFPGHFMVEWPHDKTQPVDQVPGGFMCVRRDLFAQLGGFDERFFMYFEDVDLSLRAKQAGWNSVFFSEAQAFHPGRGTTDQIKARRLFYFLRSRAIYFDKHNGRPAALAILGGTLLLEPIPRLVMGVLQGGGKALRENLRGYGMLVRALPILFKPA